MPTNGNGHDDEVTVRSHIVLNANNRPLVECLYHAAETIETSGLRVADGLRDIAKSIQLATNQIDEVTQERIGRFTDEHAQAIKPVGQRIREAGR